MTLTIHEDQQPTSVNAREEDRRLIAQQTEEFLAAGGIINQVDVTARADAIKFLEARDDLATAQKKMMLKKMKRVQNGLS